MNNRKRKITEGRGRQRRISVREVRRDRPDIPKLGNAVADYAAAAAEEAAAQADHARHQQSTRELPRG
jgi:hypothetical protein